MKVFRPFCIAGLDHHGGELRVAGLDRDTLVQRSDTGKHLAAHFPGIMATAPGIGTVGPGQRLADLAHEIPAHDRSLSGLQRRGKGRDLLSHPPGGESAPWIGQT